MKKLKKQQLINAILREALWYHIVWQEETDVRMKNFLEYELSGIFCIIRELDMVNEFWELRRNFNVYTDIKAFGISGMNSDYEFTKMEL